MSTKQITIAGIGIALFVALSMCLRVPIFENYYVCLGYVVMTIYLYSVGIGSGMLVGIVGTFLYCVLIGGLRGMLGWVLGNAFICIPIGTAMQIVRLSKKSKWDFIFLGTVSLLSTAVGILGVKSLVECILYGQPMSIRIVSNMSAFIADAVTIAISLPLCFVLDKYIKRYISN